MKNNNLIVLVALLIFTFNCKAQSQFEYLNNYTTDIIGVWVLEDDSTHKIEFTSNNTFKVYINNVLEDTSLYSLGITCGTNSNNGYDIFLKFKENNLSNDYVCDVISNIHTDSNGLIIMSITTERGQLETYVKQ